jgi:peptidoglycan/LPS O-acetylase OafA/YrhL
MQRERLAHLDGWRGMAIIGVLIGHYLPTPGFNAGRAGVELFFSLSGCLIGALLFNMRMPLDEFVAKRLARIVPSMWVLIVVAVLLALLLGETLRPVWMYVLGVGNYATDGLQRIDHLWSVGVELQGYASLALIAFISGRTGTSPAPWILAVVAASWVLTFFTAASPADYYRYYWHFEYRLTAMLLAACLMTWKIGRQSLPDWRLLLCLGLVLQLSCIPDFIKYTGGSAVLALACRALFEVPRCKGLENRVLVMFGRASFSIYLYQQLFMGQIGHVGRWWALMLALVVGFAVHHLWDQHLHRATSHLLLGAMRRRWKVAAS